MVMNGGAPAWALPFGTWQGFRHGMGDCGGVLGGGGVPGGAPGGAPLDPPLPPVGVGGTLGQTRE